MRATLRTTRATRIPLAVASLVGVLWGCGSDATDERTFASAGDGGSAGASGAASVDSGPSLDAGAVETSSSAGSGGTSNQWPGTAGQSGAGTAGAAGVGVDGGTSGSGGSSGTGTQGTTCSTDGDCQFGLSCQLAVNGAATALTWQCEPFVGAQFHGTACTQDQDCRSGMCKGGFCSTPCETGADCFAEATCQVETLSLGGLDGSFGICLVQLCASSADCGPGAVCSSVTQQGTSYVGLCRQEQPGASLGQPCSQASDCASSLCGGWGTCAEICETDVDCGGVSPMRCVDLYNNGSQTIAACAPACSRESDCPTGTSCVVQRDTAGNRSLFACGQPLGAGGVGADCSGTIDCVSGLCLSNYYNGALVDQICTGACSTGTDCPAGYQKCVTIQMEGPAGGNLANLGVCTHP